MELQSGQVAVITGGASGLGRALADGFAARGLHLVLADVEPGPLGEAVAQIEATGASAIGIPTDVRLAAEVDALAAATLEHFGRVDVVVNNAGVTPLPSPIWDCEENDWEWVLSVNLWGVIHGVRAFVPHLIAQNSGHIVNTASMAGLSAGPGLGPYMASKHAVVALSEGLSADLAVAGVDVRVTIVCPGQMATNIYTAERNRPTGLGVVDRAMTEPELAAVAEWMASISGSAITGTDAAEIVIRGIENDALFVAPNGSSVGVRARVDRLLAELDGG